MAEVFGDHIKYRVFKMFKLTEKVRRVSFVSPCIQKKNVISWDFQTKVCVSIVCKLLKFYMHVIRKMRRI